MLILTFHDVRNVSMICQIHMRCFGKRPSAVWYNTNKDGCYTQQHTWLKEFDPPKFLLEMWLQENWIALLIFITAGKMWWKDDQKWDQDKITVEWKRKKTCFYLARFSLSSVAFLSAFCKNVHCTCLWGGSDPLRVTMHCGCREATPQRGCHQLISAVSLFHSILPWGLWYRGCFLL